MSETILAAHDWLLLAYGGDVTGRYDAARPDVAAQTWDRFRDDPAVACAAGHLAPVRVAIDADPGWLERPVGSLSLPPLVAVTQSHLGRLPDFIAGLRATAEALLTAGADPNGRIGNRSPPASLAEPDPNTPLSALYGAAGVIRDPVMTQMLLEAGADPNDGESLYHALESPDCTALLLQHGARVGGSNAVRRALDLADADALELLLAHGGDPNEPPLSGPTAIWGAPLLRAIAVGSSMRHVDALLAAGADPRAQTDAGVSAYQLAMFMGRDDVADRLHAAEAADTLSPEDQFIAACARGDVEAAREIRADHPDLPGALAADRLRLLPDTAAWGRRRAVEAMVECDWPIDARGGDWDATALNHAVMRGDAGLARFLVAHGASWREEHGYGSDVLGTLSWASLNAPSHTVAAPDWPGCAHALAAGMPAVTRDPAHPERLMIEGRSIRFADDVADALLLG